MVQVGAVGDVSVDAQVVGRRKQASFTRSLPGSSNSSVPFVVSPFSNSEWSHSLKRSHTINSFPPPIISFHMPPNPNSATVKIEMTHFFETLEHIFLRVVIIQNVLT